MDAIIQVLKRWGEQHKASVKSKTLKAMLQNLMGLGVLPEPIDGTKPELWPQIEAVLTEQAKLGRPEHLVAWGKANAMMIATWEEQQAWRDAKKGLRGLAEETTQTEELTVSSDDEEGEDIVGKLEAWPIEGKPSGGETGAENRGRRVRSRLRPQHPPCVPLGGDAEGGDRRA